MFIWYLESIHKLTVNAAQIECNQQFDSSYPTVHNIVLT